MGFETIKIKIRKSAERVAGAFCVLNLAKHFSSLLHFCTEITFNKLS